MTLKYITNKRGNKTAVVISIKDWVAFKMEHEKLIQRHKKISKKVTSRKKSDSEAIRNFTFSSNAFSFWENSNEDLYQDYLRKK